MGGRRRSVSDSDSESSASSTSSSSDSDSGSSSCSSSSSGSGSGSQSASSSCSEERRRRREKRKRRKKLDAKNVAQLQQQLQHVERLQLLQRRAAAARALADASSPNSGSVPPPLTSLATLTSIGSLAPPPLASGKRKHKRREKKERRKRKRDKKNSQDKTKKHKRKRQARTSVSEPEQEEIEKVSTAKMKSVRTEKKVPAEPLSPPVNDSYRHEENSRKRKIPQDTKGNIPDFRDDRVYDAEEHRNRYTKAKYTDEKDYNSNNRREDKPESRPRSETQPQRKNDSDKHIEKSQSRNREDFDVRSDRNNHNLSYEQKRRRFDKDMPEEGFANNHKKYPDYDRNYKGRNDDAKDHRRFSPPRDRERDRDSRVENNSGYSKAPRNDYEPRDYSNNRKKDDNGTNRPDFRQNDSRGNQNREFHPRNEFSRSQGRNDRRYEKRFSNEPDAPRNSESVPSTSGRNEKFQRTYDRERFNSKDRRNTSSSFERKETMRGNNRPSPSSKDKDENKSYEWGKKEKKPADNSGSEKAPKDKPNFALSGKLTEETNMVNGVVIKYSEPPEGKQPKRRWRFYPFKGDKALPILYLHRQSFFLLGRDRTIADIPLDHPSISKQHAVLQYRLVPFKREDGSTGKRVRPYIIDLGSSNGTFVNNKQIDPSKYVELLERDVVKFGFSQREYVLLHENSKDDGDMDDDDVKPNIKLEDIKNIIKQEPEN